MPKYRVEILPPAWAELDEIASFHLQAVGVNSARNITDKILNALSGLEDFPLSCPHVTDDELRAQDYRMLVCGKYLCVYRLVGDCVFVYHIVAGARERLCQKSCVRVWCEYALNHLKKSAKNDII